MQRSTPELEAQLQPLELDGSLGLVELGGPEEQRGNVHPTGTAPAAAS